MSRGFALLLILLLAVSCLITMKPVFSFSSAAENTWAEKAPMHQARADLGVVVVNGKIYAIGGLILKYQDKTTIQSVDVNTNEEYNPTTNAWNYKASMPTPRDSFAIAVYQNKIYCIGGSTGISRADGQTLTVANEVFDPVTNKWENKTEIPTTKISATAHVVNGKIYVMGGYPNTTLTQEYNPDTDTWTTKTPMPIEQNGIWVVYNDKIYVIGGYYVSVVINTTSYTIVPGHSVPLTQIYDPATDNWSLGTPPPASFAGTSIGVTTGMMAPERMYFFSRGNQVYDPETNNWTAGEVIPTPRGDFSVAVVNDLIYIIGGITITYPKTIPNDAPFGSGGVATYYATVEQYTPFGYGAVPPLVSVVYPETLNKTARQVSLDFTINRPVDWMAYSLDGKDNITISGNTTITRLSTGLHNITVYAQDNFGNIGASEAVTFKIEESFPTVAVAVVSIALVVAGLLVYFKKRQPKSGGKP